MARQRRLWVARKRISGRNQHLWYASLDGLTWLPWETSPSAADARRLEDRLFKRCIDPVPIATISELRGEGYEIASPKR